MEQLTGTMSSVPDSNNYENMSHKRRSMVWSWSEIKLRKSWGLAAVK